MREKVGNYNTCAYHYFFKATRLSNNAKKATTVGEIMNMMSVDAYKFLFFTMYVNLFWDVPFITILCTALLYILVGPACFVGLIFIAVVVPLNTIIVGKIHQRHHVSWS